jgi:hypothetical protein
MKTKEERDVNSLSSWIYGLRRWVKRYCQVLSLLLFFLTWLPGFFLAVGAWDTALVTFIQMVTLAVIFGAFAFVASKTYGQSRPLSFALFLIVCVLSIAVFYLEVVWVAPRLPYGAPWPARWEGYLFWFFATSGLLWWGETV